MTELYSRTFRKPAPDWFYFGVRSLFSFWVNLLIHPEYVGRDNLPAEGAYLLTSNHLSFFDSILIFCVIPQRLVALGADKWRRTPGLAQFMEAVGTIWVARGEVDRDALKATLEVLKRGGHMGMAPEGTRSRTHVLQPGKTGAAYIADRTQVPIVPIGQAGTERVIASWKRLRRPRVRLVVGTPFRLPGNGRAKGAELDAHTEEIMCRIAALLPPEYRGVYADHPRVGELLAEGSEPAPTGPAA